jgi:hypothetical protein
MLEMRARSDAQAAGRRRPERPRGPDALSARDSMTPRSTTPIVCALLAELSSGAVDEETKQELARALGLVAEPDRLLAAAEKGAQLGLHPDTLVKKARAGLVPGARKVGREWRFPAGQLDILPAAQPPSNPPPPTRSRRPPTTERRSVTAIRNASRRSL